VAKKYVNLNSIINLSDFETAASQLLPPKLFAVRLAYLSNNISKKLQSSKPTRTTKTTHNRTNTVGNSSAFTRSFFVPSPSQPPSSAPPSQHHSSSLPAGAGKLAHPQGEVLMTQAATQQGVLQRVCNMAGCLV
jgi:L-lactate dehydrogenase (cytochrome)